MRPLQCSLSLGTSSHSAAVCHSCWSPDGKTIVTSSKDGSLKLWDSLSGRCLGSLEGHSAYVYGSAFRPPEGDIIATASWDRTVRHGATNHSAPRHHPATPLVSRTPHKHTTSSLSRVALSLQQSPQEGLLPHSPPIICPAAAVVTS